MVKLTTDLILKQVLPRVLKAVLWGSVTFLVVYYLPMMLYPQDLLPIDYTDSLIQFAIISVFFTVMWLWRSKGTCYNCFLFRYFRRRNLQSNVACYRSCDKLVC